MIKHVLSSNPLIKVSCPSSPYIVNQGLSLGQVRYNIYNNNMEVYDGRDWISISQTVNIDLHPDLHNTFIWARNKMSEEERLRKKAELFPSIKEVLDDIETLKAKLSVLDTLCDETDLDNAQNST